jgi:hypothetical protein
MWPAVPFCGTGHHLHLCYFEGTLLQGEAGHSEVFVVLCP